MIRDAASPTPRDDDGSERVVVDARGVLCPVPIIRLARAARAMLGGGSVTLLSDDPAAAHDVPAWCGLRGHELISSDEVADPDDGRLLAVLAAIPPGAGGGPPVEPTAPNPLPGHVLIHVIRVSPGRPPRPATSRGERSDATSAAPHAPAAGA